MPFRAFTDQCIHDPENPVCRQCFIGKAANSAPSENTACVYIPIECLCFLSCNWFLPCVHPQKSVSIRIDKGDLDERIKQFLPHFMGLMDTHGMGHFFEMNRPKGLNLSPLGSPGPFGVIEMGGMFTILKVRKGITSYDDPGWYKHLEGTVAESINKE